MLTYQVTHQAWSHLLWRWIHKTSVARGPSGPVSPWSSPFTLSSLLQQYCRLFQSYCITHLFYFTWDHSHLNKGDVKRCATAIRPSLYCQNKELFYRSEIVRYTFSSSTSLSYFTQSLKLTYSTNHIPGLSVPHRNSCKDFHFLLFWTSFHICCAGCIRATESFVWLPGNVAQHHVNCQSWIWWQTNAL